MLFTYNQTCKYLNHSRDAIRKRQLTDPTFPKAIKMGTSRQAAVYFDSKDIEAWIELQKSKNHGEV